MTEPAVFFYIVLGFLLSVQVSLSLSDWRDGNLSGCGLVLVLLFCLAIFSIALWQVMSTTPRDDGQSLRHFLWFI